MQELFFQFVGVSITTSIFIILLFVLSPIIQERYRVRWRYFIWLFLAFRLVLPLNLGITEPPVEIDIPNIGIPYGNEETVTFEKKTMRTPPGAALVIDEEEVTFPAGEVGAINEGAKMLSISKILTFVYFAGVAIFLLGQMVLYLSFRRSIKRWYEPVEKRVITEAFEKMKAEMRIEKSLRLRVCRKISSPMIAGLIMPTLLLPHQDYQGTDLELILKHELTHFLRNDLWFKLLLIFVQGLHWYNPLVYLMVREANKDIEMACDEEVLKDQSSEIKKRYSERILELMELKDQSSPPVSTSFHGGKNMMRDRIRGIFDEGKKKQGIFAIALLIVAVVLGSACKIQAMERLEIAMTPHPVTGYSVDLDGDGTAETRFQLENRTVSSGYSLVARRDWRSLGMTTVFGDVNPEVDYGFQAGNMIDSSSVNFLVSMKEEGTPLGGSSWKFYTWKNGKFDEESLKPVKENVAARIISFGEMERNALRGDVTVTLKSEADYIEGNPVMAFYFENRGKDRKGPETVYYAPLSDYDLEGYRTWQEDALNKTMIDMRLVTGDTIIELDYGPSSENTPEVPEGLADKVFLETTEVLYISLPKVIATITSYYAFEKGNWVHVTGRIE